MTSKSIRPIRIDGVLAFITLTKGYEAVIDVADVPLVAGYNWYALVMPRTVYAARNDRSGPKKRNVFMHRVILGEPEGLQTDHKDGNGLNNTRDNLREATISQNGSNRRIGCNNTSGYKGVRSHKRAH